MVPGSRAALVSGGVFRPSFGGELTPAGLGFPWGLPLALFLLLVGISALDSPVSLS